MERKGDLQMSGGYFDYKDVDLKREIFGWDKEHANVFEDREITKLVLDVLNLIHEFDWYKSGDTDGGSYLRAKKAFKEKWLEPPVEVRAKKIIDEAVEEVREDLYKTFNVNKSLDKVLDEDEALRRKLFASLNGGRYD